MTMNANADKIFSLRSTRDRHVRTLHKSVAFVLFLRQAVDIGERNVP